MWKTTVINKIKIANIWVYKIKNNAVALKLIFVFFYWKCVPIQPRFCQILINVFIIWNFQNGTGNDFDTEYTP